MGSKLLFLISFCGISFIASAQGVITMSNPSFEGVPKRGLNLTKLPEGCLDCGKHNFPTETAPDIHPANYFENTLPPSDGNTYLGIVVRDNDSWESVSQKLTAPLLAEQCYEISLEIAQSPNYWSGSRQHDDIESNYNYVNPTVLRIWGGTTYCGVQEKLAESIPITNSDWMTYHFKLNPTSNYKYITFEAFYKTPTWIPYNGHILLDNVSNINIIPCEKDIVAVTDFVKIEQFDNNDLKENHNYNKPQSKKHTYYNRNKKTKNKKPEITTYTKAIPKVTKKEKSYGIYDSKLKKGQIINLEKLYFQSDTSSINDESYVVLEELYNFLSKHNRITIEVGGHTNSTPPRVYCDKLSTERAKVIAEYLINRGVSEKRITYKGYGKRKPITTNRTKKGRKRNQRVEIKITGI